MAATKFSKPIDNEIASLNEHMAKRPDFANAESISISALNTPYTFTKNGYLYVTALANAGEIGINFSFKVSGLVFADYGMNPTSTSTNRRFVTFFIPVSSGDTLTIMENANVGTITAKLVPYKN